MIVLFQYSYRNLWVRRMTTALTAGGMGLVVFVFAAVLMLAEGLEKTLVSTGSADNAVFIRRASETEVQSTIERDQAAILEGMPEVATSPGGEELAAREVVILISLNKRETENIANVTVRGVDPHRSVAVRPQLRLAAGRWLGKGTSEIVLGKSIAQRFDIGGLGESIRFGMRSWTVVGILDADGTGFDSEVWADVDVLMAAFNRPVYSSVIVRLKDTSLFASLHKRTLADPRLTVDVQRERDYYAAQSELMARFIRILGIALTLIFSIGAVIGAMVTMYAAVAHRFAEIGTLRALGFQQWTILTAFLLESFLLSIIGAVFGLAAASLMDRVTISTMNWQTFSELSFRFTLTGQILLQALAFACFMGLLGGMLPALRASRLKIVDTLRPR